MIVARESGIQWPVLRTVEIKLKLAGDRARFPNSINVIATESDEFLGRIHTDCTAESRLPEWATIALRQVNEDPIGAARFYGHKTGNCSFCGRHLETKESVHVGYGPICAEKYGLPWGETE